MMKMKTLIAAVIITLSLNTLQAQVTISDVTLPAKLQFNNKTLVLNGGGLREKLWIDLYVAGLYLPEKMNNAERIIAANQTQVIRLEIVSGLITSEKMEEAIQEGFEKSTNGNLQPLKDRIDAFKAFFSQEEIVKKDVFDLVYVPGKGVVVYKNKKLLGTIKGLDFKRALWGIWLGKNNVDDDLKEGLLGHED